MTEKRVNPRIVFLLVLLIAVGIFLLYSRLTFTGFVTSEYFSGSVVLHDFSNASIFENTQLNINGDAIVLNNLSLIEGNFTSPFFAAPNDTEVFWIASPEDFDISLNPSTSSASFYYRACNDNINCTVEFIPITSNEPLIGKYFQYKVEMKTSLNSPKFYGVTVDYHTPLNLPISIDSPQNLTYNNETILLKITANSSSVWFFNGTGNETYITEVNRAFAEGSHVITAWIGDAYGNVNSTSVTFTVAFLRTYYRFGSNACATITLTSAQKTASDYGALADCESHIEVSSNDTNESEDLGEITEECVPDWVPGEWGACVGGVQTRTCEDANACEDTEEICPTEQACTVEESQPTETTTPATTEETPKKGFFTIVGSVVAAPFNFVLGNRTRIFIFSGALLLIIGFLVFKFSLKTRLKVLKLLNLRKKKGNMD